MPSSTFDSTFSSPLATAERPRRVEEHGKRASDDISRTRPKFLGEVPRPSTSSTGTGITLNYHNRSRNSPEPDNDYYTSGFYHDQSTTPRRSNSRETQDDGPGPALHNITRTIYYDRPVQEDSYSFQAQAARKSRFNRLNPMSLLSRRRSSQNTTKLEDIGLNTLTSQPLPDKKDVSIRGTKVHDFSTPRSRKSHSDSSPLLLSSPSYPRRPDESNSPSVQAISSTPVSTHSPMFREHFQETSSPLRPGNTALLTSSPLQAASTATLPSFAKKLPLNVPESNGDCEATASPRISTATSPPLPPAIDVPQYPVTDLPKSSGLPKHFNSTSSRFSFIGQQGSAAQEKLLEAKHKALENTRPASVRFSSMSIDDEDDVADYDIYANGYDEDDGFGRDEDQLPARNIDIPAYATNPGGDVNGDDIFDAGAEEFDTDDIVLRNIDVPTSRALPDRTAQAGFEQEASVHNCHPKSHRLSTSDTSSGRTQETTPRDTNRLPRSNSRPSSPPLQPDSSTGRQDQRIREASSSTSLDGLGISTTDFGALAVQIPTRDQLFEDDLYFDSGEFGDLTVEDDSHFDEELLDDPGSGIRDIPAENARRQDTALRLMDNVSGTATMLRSDEGPRTPTTSDRPELPLHASTLTTDNLAAYHDALAQAATKAAANGKFKRSVTFSDVSEDETDSPFHPSAPELSSRESRCSNNMPDYSISDDEAVGLDDEMDDEALIAAANSEALENDDDGFYGQEFGFYARAYAKDSTQLQNGGYFTSHGASGIKRSHSGKNNFQEPSLTPITERSEWSTRNSVTSFGHFPVGQPLPSPGISQLLERDSPLTEDEVSLSALMRLRRGAFGGSSTSINSTSERHNPTSTSSPLAYQSYNSPLADALGSRLALSSPIPPRPNSMTDLSDDEDDAYAVPTLTQNTPHKKPAEPRIRSSSREDVSGDDAPTGRKSSHSRTDSGSESVSYARDEQGRWVLERRRRGDGGQLEVVGREYLGQLRI